MPIFTKTTPLPPLVRGEQAGQRFRINLDEDNPYPPLIRGNFGFRRGEVISHVSIGTT